MINILHSDPYLTFFVDRHLSFIENIKNHPPILGTSKDQNDN